MLRMNSQYAILILAAGSSSRMGSPKQLLSYKGKTLLQHSIDMALEANIGRVFIVLGANAKSILNKLEHTKSSIIINETWIEGMSSSIRLGAEHIINTVKKVEGILIMVGDQPYINHKLLQRFIQKHEETTLPIIVASYNKVLGVPAFFHQTIFHQLLQLRGDKGARELIKKQINNVGKVFFEGGVLDIDTPEDYRRLLNDKS